MKKKKNKILLLGSSGVLGKKLYQKLTKKYFVIHNGIKKRKLNLVNINNLKKLVLKSKPDLIVNCLAITNIDFCEKNPKLSFKVNVQIVENIFKIKKKNALKFKFIQISTDQLYDLNINNKTSSEHKVKINNIYSKHKFLAEKIAKKNNSLIFRTNFFGNSVNDKKTFSYFVFKNFKKQKNFDLVSDVYFSPLSLDSLTLILYKIITYKKYKNTWGLYNLGSKFGLSKFEFAKRLSMKLGIYNNNYNIKNINDIVDTRRSKNMKMNLKNFLKTFKIKLPTLSEEINKFENLK